MNIKKVKYQLNKEDDWNVGYIIGAYDGENKVLLNKDFEAVPEIKREDGTSFIAYDIKRHFPIMNITIEQ